ncbi:MAG: hypothetical protein AAFX79_02710 [Planctomycetota bacterium]
MHDTTSEHEHAIEHDVAPTALADDIRGVVRDIERRLQRLREAHESRPDERAQLEHRASQLDEQQAVLLDRARAIDEAESEYKRRVRELDDRERQLRESIEAARREREDEQAKITGQLDQPAHEREAIERQVAELEQREAEARRMLTDAEEDRRAISATAVELDQRQQDLDAQAAELARRARENAAQLRAVEERAGTLDEQDRRLAALARQLAERQEQIAGASDDLKQQQQWLAENTRQADLLRARVAALEAELEQSREAQEQPAAEPAFDAHPVEPAPIDAAAEERLAEYEAELEQANTKLRHAAEIIAQLRTELDQGASAPASAPIADEHLARRRQRLASVRRALRRNRDALAQERQAAEDTKAAAGGAAPRQGKAPASASRLRVFGLVFATVAFGVGLLGGLSWLAAGHFATPTYNATVVISHDARGREVTSEDLAGWQAFHEDLLSDPRFMEFAAERMQRRGILQLASAIDLRSFLETSVSAQSGRDGELMLEVRDVGSGRAVRVADTLAIALIGQANAARDRRPDGLPSVVTREARADAEPVHDERPVYAGGILGGGTLACALLAGVLSRRLARVREEVDNEGRTALHETGDDQFSRITIG